MQNLAKAMASAFPDIEGAVKDKTNPHFRSKYADLGNVVDAIKPAIVKHGLWFTQVSHNVPEHAAIETIIVHSSGETMSCGVVAVPVSKQDAQGYGSAMTYARRYSLSAAFGVAPEDDDGNAAAKAAPKKPVEAEIPKDRQDTIKNVFEHLQSRDDLIALWKSLSPAEQAWSNPLAQAVAKKFDGAKDDKKSKSVNS